MKIIGFVMCENALEERFRWAPVLCSSFSSEESRETQFCREIKFS